MMRDVEITTKGIWAMCEGHVDIFKGHLTTPKGNSWIISELLLRDYINKGWNRSGVSLSLRGGTGLQGDEGSRHASKSRAEACVALWI